MALIRTARIPQNVSGRVGCQFQSPFTWGVYYVSLEHGTIFLRDWAQHELAREDGVAIQATCLSACMINDREVAVTVAGFTPGGNDSGLDTYVLALPGG